MNNDLISREALRKSLEELKKSPWCCEHRDTIDGIASRQAQKEAFQIFENLIDNAPTVEAEKAKESEIIKAYTKGFDTGVETVKDERLQGEFAEKLKDRIEESVCKYCQMNKHCELCEISRVFQIITLTAEEQKEGAE